MIKRIDKKLYEACIESYEDGDEESNTSIIAEYLGNSTQTMVDMLDEEDKSIQYLLLVDNTGKDVYSGSRYIILKYVDDKWNHMWGSLEIMYILDKFEEVTGVEIRELV